MRASPPRLVIDYEVEVNTEPELLSEGHRHRAQNSTAGGHREVWPHVLPRPFEIVN